jgi:hypothetical protein
MGYVLSDRGHSIVRKGGHDDVSDDDLVILEILKRAPGLSKRDLEACFISIISEYGNDALAAITSGHVRFEERPAGEWPTSENTE